MLTTEDEAKVMNDVDKIIANHEYEADTGMPAITTWLKPADEMYTPKEATG